MICDFLIKRSDGLEDIYVEFWGLEDSNEQYKNRKVQKENIYKEHNLNLLSLHEREMQNIDDILADKLYKQALK